MQLTLMNLNRIVAPCIVRKFHHTILSLDERHFVHLVRAVQMTMQGVHRLTIIQTDAALLRFASLHVGDIESGVATYLEVNLTLVRVVNMPNHTYLIIVYHIAYAQHEVVGVNLFSFLARFQGERYLTRTLVNHLKRCVSGKTVSWQVVFLAFCTIGFIVYTANDRK